MAMETVRAVYTVIYFSPSPSPPEKETSGAELGLKTTVFFLRIPPCMVGTCSLVKTVTNLFPPDHGTERTGTALLFHTVIEISLSVPRMVLETICVIRTEKHFSLRRSRESRHSGLFSTYKLHKTFLFGLPRMVCGLLTALKLQADFLHTNIYKVIV